MSTSDPTWVGNYVFFVYPPLGNAYKLDIRVENHSDLRDQCSRIADSTFAEIRRAFPANVGVEMWLNGKLLRKE